VTAITPGTRLIALTNLHNPSGALMPVEMSARSANWRKRAHAHVLVDEVYLEMLFDRSAPFCFPLGEALAAMAKILSSSPAASRKSTA